MQFGTPQVFHIANTILDVTRANAWLEHIGAGDWETDAPSDTEQLVEMCGRRCYKSFGTDLNPNITKVREGNYPYLGNIIKTQHGSVIEHAYDSFAFEDVSRIFTHELVRHRLANYSQESMRFVRPTSLSTVFPSVYTDHLTPEKASRVRELYIQVFESVEEVQQELIAICGMDEEGLSFTVKKLFQSANRRLIPDGMLTGIVMTANHRTWRFVIQQRTSFGAEEEIRYVFWQVFNFLSKAYPALYQDAQVSDESALIYDMNVPEVTFVNHKI